MHKRRKAMPAPEIIHQLVQQFTDNRDAYRSGRYNEAQLRQEFLNPFFEALGWDVSNRKGYSINYREVVHEDSIHIKGSPHAKAPDYAFRLGGVRKFFVEAKKPAEDIQFDRELAYQLKVYAWNVGLPVSILTDFEEFAVYDCRNKPNPSDSPAAARILYLRYDQYIEKWDEIAGIFSPLAIQKGAFDRYVADTSSKRGTTRVDDAFLADIEAWRTLLARNIALRNQHVVNERQLNYAVQMTIDRIIFLRICEDRGIEPANQLLEISKSKGIYPQMVQLYQRADLKYNSGLFHFKSEKGESNHADKFTPSLEIDDRVLKEIIKSLYYPCPYIFKEIPVEILGQVYEQFLGKVIRLTPGRQAKVEEKPEVRKAGGVYYTPSYIVAYIVANTLGKLVEDKTPEQVSQLRVVDPACGSGSFLLGAFQYLLDWHEVWYLANDPGKWAKGKQPALLPTEGGDWKLTTAEKKRILVNNIYGVDIDAQAVEVTKLSLLLKVLEEESGQLSLGLERVLPDLGDNIKCGNSLIGWDYFEGQLIPDEKELERVNPFDWQRNFPQVFANGGFDAVIGNPPWISLSGKFGADIYPKNQINYLINKFNGNTYMPNMYEYFVSKGLNLINNSGFFGFIVPDRLGFNRQFINLRQRIINEVKIHNLLYKSPFPGITADTLIFIFQKSNNLDNHVVEIMEYKKDPIKQKQSEIQIHADYSFGYFESNDIQFLVNSINEKCKSSLKDLCSSTSGFGGKSKLITNTRVSDKQIPTLKGESIRRYKLNNFLYFEFNKKNITGRTTDPIKLGANPKILIRKTGDHIVATYDTSGVFPEQSLYFLYNNKSSVSFFYILGVLNSKLLNTYFMAKSLTNKQSIAQVKKIDLDELPIFDIDFSNKKQVEQHDRMVTLVERMLELHKRDPQTPQEADRIQREIAATDGAIDKLVYELYGLTEEEIKIIEAGSS